MAQDEQQTLSHPLEVNIFVEEGALPRLAVNWRWLPAIFSEQDIAALHDGIGQALSQLVAFAARQPAQAAATLVAAELAPLAVSDGQLQQWQQRHGPLADALPLLPLQHGLLFHAQTAAVGGSYNSLTV
ncbi:peptide synthase [Serratia rubidaea]|uniref:Peptide synthase n=1 Tax=Serratia rubidaea TaxID=61652 RepID=A0A3S5DFK7_SERRU|nr:peptide synthase [Serratia rubidaea]